VELVERLLRTLKLPQDFAQNSLTDPRILDKSGIFRHDLHVCGGYAEFHVVEHV
jgi:hypothetical protein